MFSSSKKAIYKVESDSQESQNVKSQLNIVGLYLNQYAANKQQIIPGHFQNLLQGLRNRTEILKLKLIEKHNLYNVDLGKYEYKCKHCQKSFDKPTSLGGHVSKTHHKRHIFDEVEQAQSKAKSPIQSTRLYQNSTVNQNLNDFRA